jgi:glucose-1-phosphate thymidylyltransferase
MKVTTAILTGGGEGTRLHPITQNRNKHMVPLGNKPMIFHAIETAVDAGIEKIYINLNPGETELQKHIGDGGHWGIDIEYFKQEGGPQGLAHVVKQGEDLVKDEPFLFYLSDNIFLEGVEELIEEFESGNYDCMLALSKVEEPERYGVPKFHKEKEDQLKDVLEKPDNPPNSFAVTGAYIYSTGIFFDAFDEIEKSDRGEYEISDIHSRFIDKGKKVGYKEVTGWWTDTGKPPALLEANKMILDDMEEEKFPKNGLIDEEAEIKGKVHLGAGTKVGPDVQIDGPVIIGENCKLENCKIGPYVTIGTGVEIQEASVENSVIMGNTELKIDIDISGSLIGEKVKVNHKKQQREKARKMLLGDKTEIEV